MPEDRYTAMARAAAVENVDDRPEWDRNLSAPELAEGHRYWEEREQRTTEVRVIELYQESRTYRDREPSATELAQARARDPWGFCSNCKLDNILRPSGRCETCEKYHYRNKVERPQALIQKQVARQRARAERWEQEQGQ